MLTLGQKIKAIRKEKGLTQAELVGDRITRNQLSLIENGINNPSISTLEFIASRLNVPMSFFLSNDEFSIHKCQKLVTRAEALLDAEEYQQVVNEIEEFLNNINNEDENTMRDILGRTYTLLGIAYLKIDRPKAKAALQEAIRYLEDSDQTSYLSKAYNYLGVIYDEERDFEQADHCLSKANNLITNVTLDNVTVKLNIAYNLAFLYLEQERYSEMIDFINENLRYSKKYKIFHNFGVFNMLISIAYRFTYNYKQSILCTLKAIEYFQFSDDESSKYTCYINLGIWYRLSGDFENSFKYLDMAKKYFEYTEKIAKALNAKAELVKTLFASDRKDESFEKLVNEVMGDLNDSNKNAPDILSIKGVCLLEANDVEAAYKVFKDAEALVSKPEHSEFIVYTYIGLSKIYKYKHEWEMAYKYLDMANELPHKAIKNINFE